MKTMFRLLLGIIPGMILPIQALAENPSPGELFHIAIDKHQKVAKINEERKKAEGHLVIAKSYLRRIEQELRNEAAEEKRIKLIKIQYDAHVRRMESLTEDYLARAKMELPWFKRFVAATELADPAERKSEYEKVRAEHKALSAKLEAISKPYQDKSNQLTRDVEVHRAALAAVLGKFAKEPTAPFAGKIDKVSVSYGLSPAGYSWKDLDGKPLASASLRILGKSQISEKAKTKLLDGKYPIEGDADFGLRIWAGHVQINLQGTRKDMRKEEVLKEQIANFIDLEGLAAIEPRAAR